MLITVNGKGLCTYRADMRLQLSMVRVYVLIGWTCAYSNTCTLRMYKTSRAGPASIVMASQGEPVCVLEGVVCGHHVYKATWTPTVGEISILVRQEPGNDHDRHAVCIKVADSHRW